MTDLSSILPGFPTGDHARLIHAIERQHLTTADLLTLDYVEIAKRASLPLLDAKRLCNAVQVALQADLGLSAGVGVEPCGDGSEAGSKPLRKGLDELRAQWSLISTLDAQLDKALGGGFPTGFITEVAGERFAVKAQPRRATHADIYQRSR